MSEEIWDSILNYIKGKKKIQLLSTSKEKQEIEIIKVTKKSIKIKLGNKKFKILKKRLIENYKLLLSDKGNWISIEDRITKSKNNSLTQKEKLISKDMKINIFMASILVKVFDNIIFNCQKKNVAIMMIKIESFIVKLWSHIFLILSYISPFAIIRAIFKKTRYSYLFVDWWALTYFIASIVLFTTLKLFGIQEWTNIPTWVEIPLFIKIISIIGGIRIFEIIIYHVNVLLFDEYRAKLAGNTYAVRGYRRLIVLLLQNYMEIAIWFALIYRCLNFAFEKNNFYLNSATMSLKLSFTTMTTFGQIDIQPKILLGHILTLTQSVIGLFIALLIIARFISLIPKPKTFDELEK